MIPTRTLLSVRAAVIAVGVVGLALLAGCERGGRTTVQRGPDGASMGVVYNTATLNAAYAANQAPEPAPDVPADGPKAKDVYQNVQVLGDLSAAQFGRLMVSITQWVAPPDQSCAYCHQGELSSDALYTKVVARRMLQMVRDINSQWKNHVGATGVTCYTCHHGQPVPSQAWFDAVPAAHRGLTVDRGYKDAPGDNVALASLPNNALSTLLVGAAPIRVQGPTALPSGHGVPLTGAEDTYGLMMYMSGSLGVNCTYCHNTHSFQDWASSPPTRVTAWYGIRMTRYLNNDYLVPLASTLPANRLGPTGDGPKVGCATCHKGVYKPLFGATLAQHYPELMGPAAAMPAAAPAQGE